MPPGTGLGLAIKVNNSTNGTPAPLPAFAIEQLLQDQPISVRQGDTIYTKKEIQTLDDRSAACVLERKAKDGSTMLYLAFFNRTINKFGREQNNMASDLIPLASATLEDARPRMNLYIALWKESAKSGFTGQPNSEDSKLTENNLKSPISGNPQTGYTMDLDTQFTKSSAAITLKVSLNDNKVTVTFIDKNSGRRTTQEIPVDRDLISPLLKNQEDLTKRIAYFTLRRIAHEEVSFSPEERSKAIKEMFENLARTTQSIPLTPAITSSTSITLYSKAYTERRYEGPLYVSTDTIDKLLKGESIDYHLSDPKMKKSGITFRIIPNGNINDSSKIAIGWGIDVIGHLPEQRDENLHYQVYDQVSDLQRPGNLENAKVALSRSLNGAIHQHTILRENARLLPKYSLNGGTNYEVKRYDEANGVAVIDLGSHSELVLTRVKESPLGAQATYEITLKSKQKDLALGFMDMENMKNSQHKEEIKEMFRGVAKDIRNTTAYYQDESLKK